MTKTHERVVKFLFIIFAKLGENLSADETISAFNLSSKPVSQGLKVIVLKTHLTASFASGLYLAEKIDNIRKTAAAIKQRTIKFHHFGVSIGLLNLNRFHLASLSIFYLFFTNSKFVGFAATGPGPSFNLIPLGLSSKSL